MLVFKYRQGTKVLIYQAKMAPTQSTDHKHHKSDWNPCHHCNSMVCETLCPNYRRKSVRFASSEQESPPPPYTEKDESKSKASSIGGTKNR